MATIDCKYCFLDELPEYWEGVWDKDDFVPHRTVDPDQKSDTQQEYHRILWSKPLPNGDMMMLTKEKTMYSNALRGNGFLFTSDAIINSFPYYRIRGILSKLKPTVEEYKNFMEQQWKGNSVIAATMIWPCRPQSINQERGRNLKICDRFDRTLECARRYYCGQESPLSKTLEKDKRFFDLFVNFKGFVDFFLLQDCVSPDYSSVNVWLGDTGFDTNPLPSTPEEYYTLYHSQQDFLNKRTARIETWVKQNL
ncbi:MAG: hypothetical protein LIP03_02835 [Bacteroidales bacterium]|nr:hypothetical protein [Bacteroidales bacterium]